MAVNETDAGIWADISINAAHYLNSIVSCVQRNRVVRVCLLFLDILTNLKKLGF